MTKRTNNQTSVKQRREAYQKQKQAERRRWQTVGAVAVVIVLAVVAWQVVMRLNPSTPEIPEGERPLASMPPAEREDIYSEYPPMVIDIANEYEAVISMANGSQMRLRLFDDEAPLTVNSFVYLANQGYYDNTTFHRVLPDFMAQAGDPSGTGSGGPGYLFDDETNNGLSFDRPGLLAMANAGPNTNGSQFFITYLETPWLDGAHTIFGELVEGQDVLNGLTPSDPQQNPAGPGDEIESITIVEATAGS